MIRCLIVDDNVAFLDAASTLLAREGIAVEGVATSSAEAVRLTGEVGPDVVLVDIGLGEESGFDLARQLVNGERSPAVILISTHSGSDFADLIEQSPVLGFVPKSQLSGDAVRQLVSEPRER
jgi:DNA-binding NarL/FixJ family response regulator